MTDLEQLKKQVIVIDVETSAQYPDGREISIKEFDDYVENAKPKWFGAYSYKYNWHIIVPVRGNEQRIKNFIAEHGILVGFNSTEFDNPILLNNGLLPDRKMLEVDCMTVLGNSTFRTRAGQPFKQRGILMGFKFKRNSLKEMAKTMQLETQKGDIHYSVFFKNSWTDAETEEIKKYLYSDVEATRQMFDKLWDFWKPFTQFISDKNTRNLTWIRSSIASLTYQAACHKMGVEETYADKPEDTYEEMGGRVIEPKYEEMRDVWYVDFNSLYPNIYSMFNLFNEVEPNTNNPWHGNNVFKTKGYYDISEQHILSKDIAEKLRERLRLKKEDPKNPMVYTLKIFLNSLYGAQRSVVFEQIHTPNGGWDCCWLGQQIQKFTEDKMTELGFETVYGDSVTGDSIIEVNGKKVSIERFFNKINVVIEKRNGKETKNIIGKYCFTKAIKIYDIKDSGKEYQRAYMVKRPINKIIRHNTDKKVFRITTESGKQISVTEDHSLIICRNKKILNLRTKNIRVGDDLFINTKEGHCRFGSSSWNKGKKPKEWMSDEQYRKWVFDKKKNSAFNTIGSSKGMSSSEKIAYKFLKNKGFKYEPFVLLYKRKRLKPDFVNESSKTIIELNGSGHKPHNDKLKKRLFEKKGYKIIFITINDKASRGYDVKPELIKKLKEALR